MLNIEWVRYGIFPTLFIQRSATLARALRLACLTFVFSCAWGNVAIEAWAQRASPRTSWDDEKQPNGTPGLARRSPEKLETADQPEEKIAADLQSLYDRSQKANSVIEFNSVIESCRTIMGDSTRLLPERAYAKKLLSWAANRRGELRSDMAGEMVQSHQVEEAEKLDQSALDDFALAIENDPTRWRAHHNLGVARALAGLPDEAIQSFSTTIELNPKFVDAYHNRGEMRYRKQDFNSAIDDYSQAIKLDPKDSGLYSARGTAQFSKGEIEAALADYQAAMTLDPESSSAATLFADTCQSLGRWKEAAEAYQKGLKLDSNNVRCLQNAAWMMATCPEEFYRDPPTALKTVEKAVQKAEGGPGPNLLHVLGVIQAANGEFTAAIATLNDALQLTSDVSLRREIADHRKLFEKKKPYLQSSITDKP